MLPTDEDVSAFLDNVSEVSRLIDGLKAGTLPVQYIDGKIAERVEKQSSKQLQAPDTAQAASKEPAAEAAAAADSVAAAADRDAAKQAELLRKVEELKANRQRKLKARELYQSYVDGKQQAVYSTDYQQWDLWCPSDEEDDLFNSLTPNSPAFRAMEADISKRHARMVEQRQIAERQRQLGNAAFKAGQFSEALRCYEQGLEAQRHDMTLHANAAMAALKTKCYVAAQEHCDKVLHIAEMLHNTPKHPLCVKALQRRAAVHQGLGNYSKAVADLQAARNILPGDAEVLQQLQRAETLLQEHTAAKQLVKLVDKHPTSSTSEATNNGIRDSSSVATDQQCRSTSSSDKDAPGPDAAQVSCLQRIRELVSIIQSSSTAKGSTAISSACSTLVGLMQQQPRYRLFLRECGGLDAATQLVLKPQDAAVTAAALHLLDTACDSDTALEQLSERAIAAVVDLIGSQHQQVALAALRLAYSASICSTVRQQVGTQLSKQQVQQPKQAAAAASAGSSALKRLWGICTAEAASSAAMTPEEQVLAVSLISNCMLVPAVRTAVQSLLQPAPQQQLNGLAKLLASSRQEVSTKVLGLISNMCTSATMRSELAACSPLLQHVMQTACSTTAQQAAASAPTVSELQLAALGCLCNLALDQRVQQLLATQEQLLHQLLLMAATGPEQLKACVGATTPSSSQGISSTSGSSKAPRLPTRGKDKQGRAATDAAVPATGEPARPAAAAAAAKAAAHAATLLSRAAKDGDAVRLLQQRHNVLGVLSAAVSAHVMAQQAASQASAGQQQLQPLAADIDRQRQQKQVHELGTEWLSAAVRTLALVTAAPTDGSCCSPESGAAAITACCGLLRDEKVDDAIRGNAALVLKSFAADQESQWQPQLVKADAVGALVAAARIGRGSPSSRNAGIALALLARAGGGVFLERLRELRGLEVLYEYVKP